MGVLTLYLSRPQLTDVVDQLNAERTAEKASLFKAEQLPDKVRVCVWGGGASVFEAEQLPDLVGGWIYLGIWQGEREERGVMLREASPQADLIPSPILFPFSPLPALRRAVRQRPSPASSRTCAGRWTR